MGGAPHKGARRKNSKQHRNSMTGTQTGPLAVLDKSWGTAQPRGALREGDLHEHSSLYGLILGSPFMVLWLPLLFITKKVIRKLNWAASLAPQCVYRCTT